MDQGRVRLRAILLGVGLGVLICAITPFNNAYLNATPLGGGHFPLAAFFIFFLLSVGIAALGKFRFSSNWLSGRELFVIWILMVIASGIAYTGLVRTFLVNLTAPYHFASVGNRWQEVIQPLLPQAWYPEDPVAIELLYNGLEKGRQLGWWQIIQKIPWNCWIPPLLTWAGFVILCYWVMLCLVDIFSHQWIANEKMNFPLLRVPQLMEEALDENRFGRFLANRFLIVGLLASVLLHLINGLHFYFPAVPQIPTLILAGAYFPKHGLFSGFHKLKIYIYPAFIGFAFLTSRQISFSFWFFFLLGGLLFGLLGVLGYHIPSAALGVTFGPTLSRPEETHNRCVRGLFPFYSLVGALPSPGCGPAVLLSEPEGGVQSGVDLCQVLRLGLLAGNWFIALLVPQLWHAAYSGPSAPGCLLFHNAGVEQDNLPGGHSLFHPFRGANGWPALLFRF